MILVIILNALFALTFSAGKKALIYGSPVMLCLGRTAIAAIILLTINFIKNKSFSKLQFNHLILLLAYSLALLISIICGNWALVHVTSIKSALFYAMSPLITALISYLLFNDRFNYYKASGIMIGLLGMLLIATSNTNQAALTLQAPGWPEFILTLAVITYSIGWFLIKPLITKYHYHPFYMNGLASLISCLICIFITIFKQENLPTIFDFWIWTGLQSIVSSVICYSLYMYLLNYYSANFLSFSGFSEPIFAAFYGWFLLQETPSTMFWLATMFISIGLGLFYRGEKKHSN